MGNGAIAGAWLAAASTIIAVDVDERKLEWAREFGATHTVNAGETDPVEAIRELHHDRRRDTAVPLSRSRSQSAETGAPDLT